MTDVPRKIDGRAKTVKELLNGAKYTDEKRASQIWTETTGRWADEAAWQAAAARASDAMVRLYAGLSPYVRKAHASLAGG